MAETTSDSAPSHFENLSTYEQRVVKYNIDRQRGKSTVTDSDELKKYVASKEFTEDQRKHFAAIMFKGGEGKQKLIDAYEKAEMHEKGPVAGKGFQAYVEEQHRAGSQHFKR